MSSKSSDLRNSTSVSVLIAATEAFKASAANAPVEPAQAAAQPAAPDEDDILDDEAGSIGVMPFDEDDGTVGIGFHPRNPEPDESGSFSIYSDPDFFDAVREFFTDLDQFTVGTSVQLCLDSVGILTQDKLDLYRTLKEYVCSEEFAMTTPDTISVSDKMFDPDVIEQQRRHMRDLHAAQAREAMKDPEKAAGLLTIVANTPFTSMRDFEAACYACSYADIPIPLDHIYRTIAQEDKFDAADYPDMSPGTRISFGGYN